MQNPIYCGIQRNIVAFLIDLRKILPCYRFTMQLFPWLAAAAKSLLLTTTWYPSTRFVIFCITKAKLTAIRWLYMLTPPPSALSLRYTLELQPFRRWWTTRSRQVNKRFYSVLTFDLVGKVDFMVGGYGPVTAIIDQIFPFTSCFFC